MEIQALFLQTGIYWAGLAQIGLVVGSLAIPAVLKWKAALRAVPTLIRQMFWTYAAYILVINLSFGLLSVFATKDLTNGSLLACLLSGFIALYWISRILIQFFYFDRKSLPADRWSRLAEVVLIILFLFLSIVYSLAFYFNYEQR